MEVTRFFALLLLALLGGCAAEQIALGFASEQAREPSIRPVLKQRTIEQVPNARSKPTVAKPVEPQPVRASAREVVLPPWNVAAPKPSPSLRQSLTPTELFTNLSPSVYTVAMPNSQGSAVAVSSTELVTNCHVVSVGQAITLINGNTSLQADVVGADPTTDRCFLRVRSGALQAVPGVRDYSSLAVGEAVYTIGSPKGLVNTLGSGLLSGLRTGEGTTEYIQITAPLSEGSSGGGLFDDRGNLIGITSFTIRDSQNLNFAIAASQFWR